MLEASSGEESYIVTCSFCKQKTKISTIVNFLVYCPSCLKKKTGCSDPASYNQYLRENKSKLRRRKKKRRPRRGFFLLRTTSQKKEGYGEMVLSYDELVTRIKEGGPVLDEKGSKVVKPLVVSPPGLEAHIEGVSVDVSLGSIFSFADNEPGTLHLHEREVPVLEEIYTERDSATVHLRPGYYLVRTREWINQHIDLVGDIRTRTTLFRLGCALVTSIISPNYQGNLTFGLNVLRPVSFQGGVRIASITFYKIAGDSIPYNGLWQGGKVRAREKVSLQKGEG